MYREEKKKIYIEKLRNLAEENPIILLVSIDNIGSNILTDVRIALRGKAIIVMGKNTLIKRALYELGKTDMKIRELKKEVSGNVGLVFTKEDPKKIWDIMKEFKEYKPARKGMISPCDVAVPKGRTDLCPTRTQYFACLCIPTKITRGKIEILSSVKIVKKGEKVVQYASTMLKNLKIRPFEYRIEIVKVYDHGEIYDPEVLDLTDDDLGRMFSESVKNVRAVSLSLDSMNATSISGIFSKAFRNVLSVPVATNFKYEFPESQEMKKFLKEDE